MSAGHSSITTLQKVDVADGSGAEAVSGRAVTVQTLVGVAKDSSGSNIAGIAWLRKRAMTSLGILADRGISEANKPEVVEAAMEEVRLLEELGFAGMRIAVEVNEEVVAASRHVDTALAEGDSIEIVHAIGGG